MAATGFGYITVTAADAAWPGPPQRQAVRIESCHETKGKYGGCFLYLPDGTNPDLVRVTSGYYEQKRPGDTLTLWRYHGRLGADWYRLPPAARPGF